MSAEVCFLIGRGGAVLWADGWHSPVRIPDSRARWDAIWQHRAELEVIAHSHPVGPLGFSAEDERTMEALRQALGALTPAFAVVAPRGTVLRGADGKEFHLSPGQPPEPSDEPWWAALLRAASGMHAEGEHGQAPDGDAEHHL